MASYDDTATVSGSVVSISDGADEVGAKSCVVTVSPTLSGVSSVTETHIPSRNMASVSDADFTLNNVHYYADDGIIYIDGTSTSETSSNNNAFKVLDFWLPSGTYYFSRGATLTSLNVPAYLKKYDDKSQIVVNTGSFTLAEKTHLYIAFYVYQRVFSNIKAEICINLGSTAITYEDTAPMTTYTASIGRTIYGGTADIVNGTAEPTNYLDTANAETKSNNSVSITCDGNGKYTATGTATGGSANITFTLKTPCTIKSGMYLHLMNSGANARVSITLQKQDNTSIYAPALSPANRIADLSSYVGETIYSIRFYITNGASFEMSLTPILCYNSSVTPYSPYFTPFTFTGQEVPTRLGYNAFWSDQGDTELTYYKSGYGFTSVTVYKEQGKNLFGGWTKGYGVNSTTGEIFSRQDSAISDYIAVVPNTNYYVSGFSDEISSMVAYYDRNKVFISRSSGTQRLSLAITTPANCRYIILYQYRAGDQTASIDVIDNMQTQLEFGSEQTEYEPYVAPVSKTAYLHKVIYGGTADVVKGTCEPINWLPNVASSKTQNDIIWTVNADGTVTLEGTSTARTYLYLHTYFKILPYDATITVNVEGLYDNGTSDVFVNIPYSDNGTTYSGSYGQCTWKNPTKQINYTADKYIGFYIDCPSGTTTNQTVKITVSIGTTVHTYSPYFEPFTFPPISMETDEGENTLFANEGASAITYRKDAE